MGFSGTLFCLHGFLGQATDWDQSLPAEVRSIKPSLFSPSATQNLPEYSLTGLSKWVNSQTEPLSAPRVLVGYSLGGRIALHALLENPDLWSGAIIISANPGLSDPVEKERRIQADYQWAKKFEEEPWGQVYSDWNSQPVFRGGSLTTHRDDSEYSRKLLADSLRGCSLGHQEDLRHQLRGIKVPILWIVGEHDSKFRAIAEEISRMGLNPMIQTVIVPKAGHRILFDQPQELRRLLTDYLVSNAGEPNWIALSRPHR